MGRTAVRVLRVLGDGVPRTSGEVAMMVMKLASGAAITFRDKAALIEEL